MFALYRLWEHVREKVKMLVDLQRFGLGACLCVILSHIFVIRTLSGKQVSNLSAGKERLFMFSETITTQRITCKSEADVQTTQQALGSGRVTSIKLLCFPTLYALIAKHNLQSKHRERRSR